MSWNEYLIYLTAKVIFFWPKCYDHGLGVAHPMWINSEILNHKKILNPNVYLFVGPKNNKNINFYS